MSISKSHLKALIIHEVGVGFDGMLDQTEAEIQQVAGAQNFAKVLLSGIEGLQVRTQKRIESPGVDQLSIDEASAINKNYQTVYNYITDRKRALDAQAAHARGRHDQAQRSVDFLKKLHDEAEKKAEVIDRDGERSAPSSLKTLRQAEGSGNGANAR